MDLLKKMGEEANRLGCRKGESAKQWRERDPKAALEFASFVKRNAGALVIAIGRVVA